MLISVPAHPVPVVTVTAPPGPPAGPSSLAATMDALSSPAGVSLRLLHRLSGTLGRNVDARA